MSERDDETFELRSRALFQDSVDGLDMRIRSRLTQARSAALSAAQRGRPWFLDWKIWTPAAGVTAAAIKRIKNGRIYLIPASTETRGHLTTGNAKFYAEQVKELLATAPQKTM